MIRTVTIDGVLREQWDDDSNPRRVTMWDATGKALTGYPRDYSADEAADADRRA